MIGRHIRNFQSSYMIEALNYVMFLQLKGPIITRFKVNREMNGRKGRR